jgi:hypothetical protein
MLPAEMVEVADVLLAGTEVAQPASQRLGSKARA